jgi:hypothetical protein
MRSPALDPTAGERARRIRAHPEAPESIPDPMDSRYGDVASGVPTSTTGSPKRIVDPTDPDCGNRAI